MPNLNNDTIYNADITIQKKTNTVLTLPTEHKYVDKNIQFNLNVKGAQASLNTAGNTTIGTDPAIGTAVNIASSLSEPSSTKPNNGYYVQLNTKTTNAATIDEAGWIEQGDIGAATQNATNYLSIDKAEIIDTHSIDVLPKVEIVNQHNVILGNVDNGIKFTALGGGTGVSNASVSVMEAGYIEVKELTSISDVIERSQSLDKFISGVTIDAPSYGTNSFTIEIPNNGTTAVFTFTVDESGNTIIE